jgi:branched-chain amino acid transport system permease protein
MRQAIPFIIMAALVIVIQIVTTLTGTEFYLTQIIMSAYYSLVAIGLCLLMGYAGQISLGHAAFFAIGGYTTASLTTWNLAAYQSGTIVNVMIRTGLAVSTKNSWGSPVVYLNPWISLIAAVVAAGLIAYLIGMPVLKLRGHYLAMATLGFGTIIYRILLGSRVFGEADGISDVAPFPLFHGITLDGGRSHRIQAYYFTWLLTLACLMLINNLIRSRSGRAIRALHGNEEAAQAMGVDTARYKLHLFVFSAVIAAVAGVFLTHYNGGIGPSEASVMKSVRYVAIVAVGGMANLWGTLVASLVLNFLSLRGYFGTFDDAVFGTVLVLMMLFAPEGILRKRKIK